MNFLLCQSCGQHYWMTESQCPHCHTSTKTRWVKGSTTAAVTLLMGLGLVGCSSSDKDSSEIADTALNPDGIGDAPMYGVPDTGDPHTGDTDTSDTDTGDTGTIEPSNEADYGVPAMDYDGDGFFEDEDCDDSDANTFPGAAPNDSTTDCMKDLDGDDYGDRAPINPNVTPGTDCDDDNPTTFPGQGC
ncbi:MAG: hypothetical protein VXZ96_17855 [Myxococcota bacterium]|nr:hypothetical protein [Myxococcota bacterium]